MHVYSYNIIFGFFDLGLKTFFFQLHLRKGYSNANHIVHHNHN